MRPTLRNLPDIIKALGRQQGFMKGSLESLLPRTALQGNTCLRERAVNTHCTVSLGRAISGPNTRARGPKYNPLASGNLHVVAVKGTALALPAHGNHSQTFAETNKLTGTQPGQWSERHSSLGSGHQSQKGQWQEGEGAV